MAIFQRIKLYLVTLLTVVILLAGSSAVYCKKLPLHYQYKSADYPEYEPYIGEYYEQLNKAFNPEKHFSRFTDLYVQYYYKIDKDGNITDFHISSSASRAYKYVSLFHPLYMLRMKRDSVKFDEYVKEIIYTNPPKPFPRELEHEAFWIEVFFVNRPTNIKFMRPQKDQPRFAYDNSESIGGMGKLVPPRWRINVTRGK